MGDRSPVLYRRPSLRLGGSPRASLYTCRMSHYLLEASKGCQDYSESYLLEISQAESYRTYWKVIEQLGSVQ
jgi:hypothetical protein